MILLESETDVVLTLGHLPLPACQSFFPAGRQELLGRLRGPDPVNGTPEQTKVKRDPSARASSTSESAAPSVAQARDVVEPLERALQIYTDMQNAPQVAACHYQVQKAAQPKVRGAVNCYTRLGAPKGRVTISKMFLQESPATRAAGFWGLALPRCRVRFGNTYGVRRGPTTVVCLVPRFGKAYRLAEEKVLGSRCDPKTSYLSCTKGYIG